MDSLLDEEIAEFYKVDNAGLQDDNGKFFHVNNTYNWQEFGALFHRELKLSATDFITDFANLKYQDFKVIVKKLQPIFVMSSKAVRSIEPHSFHFQWLGSNGEALLDLIEGTTDTMAVADTANVEKLLLITALLEYGLGNVYYTAVTMKRNPPHLLRDLLSTKELLQVLGWEAICFLTILLGTPRGINLRNIVWHGFPQPAEIPYQYVAVLIVTINTIGYIISKQDTIILQRYQITEFTTYVEKIEKALPQIDNLVNTLENSMLACDCLSFAHKKFWRQLLIYATNNNWWQLVVLVLPQIELLLRLIYAQLNDYDVRAKLDEYYITMDTVFEMYLPAAEKRLNVLLQPDYEGFNESCMKLMHDLFVAPHGPRIRDKVSHGEVRLTGLDSKKLSYILLLLSKELFEFTKKSPNSTHYESLYHLNSLTWQSIANATNNLLLIKIPNSQTLQNMFTDQKKTFQNIVMDDIKMFNRPPKEAELMQLLLKAAQLTAQTCVNYNESVNERQQLLQQRELHSKRRRTFERMLEAMPEIFSVLCSILDALRMIYQKLQRTEAWQIDSQEKFIKMRRLLKPTLQISENFLKYSSKESNEWIKALQLCKKFYKIREDYFGKST